MPTENTIHVFKVNNGSETLEYPIRDSHVNLTYGTCTTVASNSAKEVVIDVNSGWELKKGSAIVVKFTYSVPAGSTLNVSGTGAKSIFVRGQAVASDDILAGDTVTFIYDGTEYVASAIDRDVLNASLKGVANGVAELDSNGKIPSSQLPSYIDDVLEFGSISNFPVTGSSGIIYVDTSTNLTYRWSGSGYIEISPSLALGTTSSTAYRGDYGNIAYEHATDSSRLDTAQSSGLYKISVTDQGHVSTVSAVSKTDITGLGIPGQDTTYTAGTGLALDGTEFSIADTDVSAGSYGPSDDATPSYGGNFSVPYFTVNSEGRIVAASSKTVTLPSSITYSSLEAASGGTDVSLCTTGEKYTWNNKSTLALGTTSTTAYRGDYGNTAYTHANAKGSAFASGLYKITTNAQGHVTAATAVAKADITALGIPSTNTTYSTVSKSAAGLCPTLPNETTTTKYLRQDGSWSHPLTNQTVTQLGSGSNINQYQGDGKSGLYWLTTGVTGAPANYVGVIVIGTAQLAFGTAGIFYRRYSGSWGKWQELQGVDIDATSSGG